MLNEKYYIYNIFISLTKQIVNSKLLLSIISNQYNLLVKIYYKNIIDVTFFIQYLKE